MKEFSMIGKSVIKIDALDKVTGVAKYASEEGLGLPGMLCGKVLYSPIAHGRIISIDTSRAEKVPGVRAVLTGKDVPPHRSGPVIEDRHVLCRETVRLIGDPVAAVAAETIEVAQEALELIDVKYEELPAIFDAEKASPDCPTVVHPDLPKYARPVYAYLGKDLPGPNVHTHHKIRQGDVEEGFKKADLIVENRFVNDRITHCQLEPYNAVAYPESDGGLTVWTSGRMFINQAPLCQAFKIPPSKLRMKSAYLGGMFGIAGRPERFAILLALKTGKPVKVVYTREECFYDGFNRIPMVTYIKDGVKWDGTIVAREMKLFVNTGAYADKAPVTIRNGSFHASQYRLPNFRWDAYGIYANEPSCGPLRGFGSAECLWATEQQMDIIAEKLGLDPVEVRKKNTVDEGETNVRGEIVHSIGAKECLDKASEWIGWGKPSEGSKPSVQLSKPGKEPGTSVKWGKPGEELSSNLRRGKGIALGNKYTMVDSAAAVIVKIHIDGRIEVRHGTDECGQGVNTVLAQIAAEEFSVPIESIKIVWGDTGVVPYDGGAASSKSTFYTGNALRLACLDAKRQMFEIAAPRLGTAPENLDTKEGKVFIKHSPEKALNFSDLFLGSLPEAYGQAKVSTCLAEGGEILGKATFWGRPSPEDPETGQGERLTLSTCYNAQAVEVEVDVETGAVKILKFVSACDVGKAINPKMCEVQLEGGAGMGIGSALQEGFVFTDKGNLLNPNFTDYHIPTSVEVPSGASLASMLVEAPHREGPYGAKGMGESAMTAAAPAIANAIYNAIGVRLNHIPMTPERILKAIKESKK